MLNRAGQQDAAMLVAAQSPAGVGVWAMTMDTYQGNSGVVFAVDREATLTTEWGTLSIPDVTDMKIVQACVDPALAPA